MAQYTFDTLLDFDIAKIVLPSGYTKLNYIENQGNASTYIDTGYVPNQNTKFRCEFSINTNTYSAMGYIGTYRYGFAVERTRIAGIFNTAYYDFYTTIPLDTPQLLEINNPTREVFLNGSLLGAVPQMNFPIGGTFWIGRWNNLNSEYFNGKIYYNEFIENGVSVQKLIPCEDGNGNIGMYDVVTDTFFANQGTNPFISGGTAPPITPITGDTATITELGLTMTYNDGYFLIVDNQTLTLSQATQLFSFAKGDNGVTATITDLGITLTSDGTDWYVTSDITIPTFSQATQLFAFAKSDNGVTATITDLGITLTSDGTDWYVTSDITIPTFSQATQLFSFAKGDNGVTATITDLGITLTSDGTDWYVTSDITIPTFSQATQLFSFAKGDNGVTATVTSTGGVYKYDGDDWQIWYTIIPPLVFKGITFEQTDYWQIPEMVFRGFSFEITDKTGGSSMFHGMS